jgi:NAD(P)H-hydrate epimerase
MRPVITPAEANRLDMSSDVPVETLMQRAGLGVTLAAVRMGAGYGSRVAVLAGRGNNGGDAYVAARYLRERGVDVTVHALGFPKGEHSPARKAASAASLAGVQMVELGDPVDADLVIDGLFGTGFQGTLPDEVVPWTDADAPVLAIDVPSGLDALRGTTDGPAFTAARTVTFDAFKVGHLVGEGPDRSGTTEVHSIGLPEPEPEFWICDDADAPVPPRRRDDHKWSVGSVAVVGGSAGMVGAAVMAASAALEFGAGAVRLITPGGLRAEAAAGRPGIMTDGIGSGDAFSADEAGRILDSVGRFDVLVLGPGIGKGRSGLIDPILARWDRPLVLDADGINGASIDALKGRSAPTIITPHAGEFERLTGEPATHPAAFDLADATGVVVLLKGSPTFVAGSERWVVTSGGPELATIGTGDVLAGMVGALVARGLPLEVAARSAAHRHGLAGRALAWSGITATALLDEIGRWAS